jgi:EAL domain-containing protein (putative c-di-GMP-specific phosphodiesterase class I)
LTVSVNISARQFREPDFVALVLKSVERAGINPWKLKLELTESSFLESTEEIIAKMTTLRAHGICFSLDDFGTGYSSLAYLKRLPLEQLKVDSSFVRDILEDTASAAIAQAVISLGKALRLTVIAEGVETEEQRKFLARLGCHAYQGYLISKPIPVDKFEELAARMQGTETGARLTWAAI